MKQKKKKMGLWEAVSLAVGTMIGASIFSILGVGADICGSNLPLAFVISAIVSYSVAYSYAKLGSVYVSNAGPIEFILRGIGDNAITGTLSILMWFSYVVSISLFAKAFAGYFLALFNISEKNSLVFLIIEAGIIAIFTVLNFFGSKAVGKAEFWIVLTKLVILLTFVLFGIWTVKPDFLKPSLDIHSILNTFYSASVLFLSYMGFGLITNASENIENPKKNVPLAIYISITIVAIVYISVAIVAVGNLGAEGLIKAKEYALAEASKPFLGDLGFLFISIGALFSTSSAINATLYGGANIAYVLAKKGELPDIFERKVWFNEPEGLYITAVLSFIFTAFYNLDSISALISFTFLIIYLFVLISHFKLTKEGKVEGNTVLISINFLIVLVIFLLLLQYQWESQRESFWTSLVLILLFFIIEKVYKGITGRQFKKRDFKEV